MPALPGPGLLRVCSKASVSLAANSEPALYAFLSYVPPENGVTDAIVAPPAVGAAQGSQCKAASSSSCAA